MITGIPPMGLDDRPIPKTADRLTSDFTVDERRILYDFVIQKTKAAPTVKVEELDMPFKKEEKERPKTYLERLAAERDAKRRKVSKKVHTNRKSHVEIMREVIQNQMELYEEHLKHQFAELRKNDPDHNGKGSDARRIKNPEHQEDQYKHRSDPHGPSATSEYRSHRKPDCDRREENKYHRDRNSSSYYRESGAESRSGISHRKHLHEERDRRRFQDDRSRKSEMLESRSKEYREMSFEYDYHGKRKHKESSRSYDSKSRTVRHGRSDSYELQSTGSCNKNEDYRSERKEKNNSNNYNSVRGEKYRDRSSSSESQYRKRKHRKSYSKEHSNNTSSDDHQHGDNDCVEHLNNSESNNSYHCYIKKEKLDNEEFSPSHGEHSSTYRTENYVNVQDSSKKHGAGNEDFGKSSYYQFEESNIREINDSYNYLEDNETDTNTSLNKSRHKRKKHKKHKKCHKKSAHKPITNENSSEDFSC